ncbi:murein biosynthesis integral membrane protein MurJ [Halomonas garicola]|uniref:murein biosynthesis integral membrane protein MurJ n=1 Tax=Halomonas garicola TaxID=1690008 RepID=UPI00289DDF08|nr:lipid II flippase MurJ [Halomonas garicola]
MRKSVIQLFGGNLFSKFLGLGREVLTAALFGTGQAIGSYRVAQVGTLVPVNFFTSDSLNSAFVPQYKLLKAVSQESAQTLFWSLAILFGSLSALLSVGLWLLAEPWVGLLAPGLDAGTSGLATDMLRIMSFGVPFYIISALLIFLGMANDDFVPMAARPSIQNIGLIAGAILAFSLKNAVFLAWGFTSSYVAFSAWVVVREWRSGLLCWPEKWVWPRVKEVLSSFWRTLLPLLFLPVMLQGNIAVERSVASLLGLAAVSSIDYAKFVSETLILLVSVPLAFVGLGSWSELSHDEMNEQLSKLSFPVLLISIPVSSFLIVNSYTVVEAAYSRGAFDMASVNVTANILLGIAIGLWAQVLGYVLIKALNAQRRNGAVLRIMAVALLANAACNLVLYPHLGAITLGLGNAAYGLVLLGGTLTALGLWRDVLERGWILAVAAIGYLLLNYVLPRPESVWRELSMAIAVAMIYWTLWVVLVPHIRKAVVDVVAPKLRKTA